MAVNPELVTAELKRAVEQFSKNIGTAGEAYRPIVAANDTTIIIYQRRYMDSGFNVIGIPRGGPITREFIATLVEANHDAGAGRPFHLVALDDQGGSGS
jgi:hypothetical protein